MKNILDRYVNRYGRKHKDFRRYAMVVAVLALIVFVGVNWRLHDKGISMTSDYQCGLKEHKHTEECYKKVLICGKEETDGSEGHTHTDACYKEVKKLTCGKEEHKHNADCYDEDGNLICGKKEHEHSDDCYTTEKELVCGKKESEPVEAHHHTDACYKKELVCGLKEHTHTAACYSDESADVEDKSDWEATIPVLSGNWAEDVVSVAQSQLGYEESTANFKLADDGETRRGYTRYGEWYGNKYGEWSAMFASFCLNYAGIPSETVPVNSGANAWITELKEQKLYKAADDNYKPAAGDLVFLDTDSDGKADHVGIITETDKEKDEITSVKAIVGDSSDKVEENTYKTDEDVIIGYCALPENPDEKKAEEADKTDKKEADTDAAESTTAAEEKTTAEAVTEESTEAEKSTEKSEDKAESTEEAEEKTEASENATTEKKKVSKKAASNNVEVQEAAETTYASFTPYVTSLEGTGTKYDKETGNYDTNLKTNFTISKEQIQSDNYRYELKYPEGIIVPDELLNKTYRLLDDENKQAGTYSFVKNADGTYSVRVVFAEDYVRDAGETINGNIWFKGKLSSSKVDDKGDIVIVGEDKVNLDIPSKDIEYPDDETNKYNIDVSKSGAVIEGGKLKYTVIINSTKGTPDDIDFTDVINMTGVSLGTPEVSVKKQPVQWYSQWHHPADESKEEDVSVNPTYDANTGKLTMTLPQLTAQENGDHIDCYQYIVTYTYDITGMDVDSATTGNTVNVKSHDQKTDTTVKDEAHTDVTVKNPYTIAKSGKITDGKQIKWTITVNANKANIAGAVLSDSMLADMLQNPGITITPNSGYDIEYDSEGKIKDIKFTAVSEGQNTQTYTITYYTPYTPSWDAQSDVKNTATLHPETGKDITGTGTVKLPEGTVDKKMNGATEQTDGTAVVNWTITINAPGGKIPKTNNEFIYDTMTGSDGNQHYMTVAQALAWDGKMKWNNGTEFSILEQENAEVKFYYGSNDKQYYTLEDLKAGKAAEGVKFTTIRVLLKQDLVGPAGATTLTYSYNTTADLSNTKAGKTTKYTNSVTVDKNKKDSDVYKYENKHTISKAAEKMNNNEIKWTITVNKNKVNIAGGVLKDDMFDKITDISKLTVSPKDPEAGYEIVKEAGADGKEKIKEIRFKAISDGTNNNKYTITYYTPYEKKWDEQQISNRAKFKPPTGEEKEATKTVTIPGCSIEKTRGQVDEASDHKTAEINWTVGIEIPDGGLPKDTVITDDMTKNKDNTAGSKQYMTVAQIRAWKGDATWDNNSQNTFNLFADDLSEATFYDANNKAYTYADIQNESNGVTSATQFIKFVIKLKKELNKPSGATKLTYSYKTTADLDSVSMGENNYHNGLWVGDKSADATYTYDKGKVVKKDGNGNTGTTSSTSENELTWKIEVTTGSSEYSKIKVTDTLPEGLKLKEISVIDNNGRKIDSLKVDNSGNLSGQNDTYKVTGTYDSNQRKVNLNVSYVDTNRKIPQNTTYTFTVVCQTNDDSQYKKGQTYTFTNTADVTFDEKEIGSSSQTQNWTKKDNTVVRKVVDKSGTWDGDAHQADYSIVLNPDGKDIVEGSDVLTLTDVLNSTKHPYYSISKDNSTINNNDITFTVELIPTTVKLYYAVQNSDGTYGKGSNPQLVQGYKWTYTEADDPYNSNIMKHTLTLTDVPDATPLILEYRYSVNRDAPDNVKEAQFQLSNTATLSGQGNNSGSSSGTEMWKESSTGGQVSTEKSYTIYKVEEGNYGKLLKGAVFKLQKYDANAEGNYSDVNPATSFTTDKNGKIQIKWNASLYQYNTLYRLVETTPPSGYSMSKEDTDIYFYFSNTGEKNSNLPDNIPSKAVDLTKKSATTYVENEANNTSISVKKNWKDSDGQEMSAPVDNIKFDLYQEAYVLRQGNSSSEDSVKVIFKYGQWNLDHTKEVVCDKGDRITLTLKNIYGTPTVKEEGSSTVLTPVSQKKSGETTTYAYDYEVKQAVTLTLQYNENGNSGNNYFEYNVKQKQGEAKKYGAYSVSESERWRKTIDNLPLTEVKNGKKVYYRYYVREQKESDYKRVDYSNNEGVTSGVITISNIVESYTLPETGGSGTLPFIAVGATLMGFALLCGYSMRRRRGRRIE